MKRIFSILAIVCLVVALAVPAFAASTEKAVVSEFYTFTASHNPSLSMSLHILPYDLRDYDHVFIIKNNDYGLVLLYGIDGNISFNTMTNGNNQILASGDVHFVQYRYSSTENAWESTANTTKSDGSLLANFFLNSNSFVWSYNYLGAFDGPDYYMVVDGDPNYAVYFTERECDGSACSAIDINFDDICDECGLTLAYNLRQTPDSYEVIVKHSDSLTLLYRYTETIDGTTFSAVYNDSRVTISFNNPVDHYQYKLVNGEWQDYASYPNTSGSHVISLSGTAEIESSDLIVYDTSGNVFFQNPLWKMILGLTQGEMTTAAQAVVGTMRVLVLCGVGLIALLVVLKLFGRRSLLYRG